MTSLIKKSFLSCSSNSFQDDIDWYPCSERESESVANLQDSGRSPYGLSQEVLPEDRAMEQESSHHPSTAEDCINIWSEARQLEVQYIVGVNKDSTAPVAFTNRNCVAYAAGSTIVISDYQTDCQIHHLSRKDRKRAFATLAISADGMWIASGEKGEEPSVLVWALESVSPDDYIELQDHVNTVTAICFSSDGMLLGTAESGQDSRIIIWDWQKKTQLLKHNMQFKANLTALSFSSSSDNFSLHTTAGKSNFTTWTFSHSGAQSRLGIPSKCTLSSKTVLQISEKMSDFVDVKTLVMGRSAFVFALNHKGILYKLRQNSGSYNIEKQADLQVSSAFNMDLFGTKLAVSCGNGVVKIIHTKNLAVEDVLIKPSTEQKDSVSMLPNVTSCTFDREGSFLAVVYTDGSLVFWETGYDGKAVHFKTVQSHPGSISDIFPVPTYPRDQGPMDLTYGKNIHTQVIQHSQDVANAFATCSDKGSVNLWELRLRRPSLDQPLLLSPTSELWGHKGHMKVQLDVRNIPLNPTTSSKNRKVARKGEVKTTSVKSKKDGKRPAATTAPLSKAKRPVTKKTPAKKETNKATSTEKTSKPVIKRKATGLKSTSSKSKVLTRTATPVRLSTDISQSKVVRTPASGWKDSVVAVPQGSNCRLSTLEATDVMADVAEEPQLTCLRVSPTGRHLVVGDNKGQLRIIDLLNKEVIGRKQVHDSAITRIAYSTIGSNGELLLATGDANGCVNIMDVHKDFEILFKKEDHDASVTGISFSPDARAVVSCAKDKYMYFESLDAPAPADESDEDINPFFSRHCLHESEFHSLHLNAERETYMVGCSDNLIRVYNNAGQFVHSLRIPEGLGAPIQILRGPIDSMVISCHANNAVCVFEYFTGKVIAIGQSHSKLTGAMLLNEGRSLLTACEDGILIMWNLDDSLIQRCHSLPMEMDVASIELGYTNYIYEMMQKERQRSCAAAATIGGDIYSQPEWGNTYRHDIPPSPASSISRISIPGREQSPIVSRPNSQLYGAVDASGGIPMFSPVAAPLNRSVSVKKKDESHFPLWLDNGGKGISDQAFKSDYESASPLAKPPMLKLPYESYTTEEDRLPIVLKATQGSSLLQTGYSDHEALPMESYQFDRDSEQSFFVGGNSVDRRFSGPMSSSRWPKSFAQNIAGIPSGRPGSVFRDEFIGGVASSSSSFVMDQNAHLQVFEDQMIEMGDCLRRRSDSIDRPWNRPTGPEPPSSVSCDSDSSHSTPFGTHPRNSFESEFARPSQEITNIGFSLYNGDNVDEKLIESRSPYPVPGPIGPHIYNRVSKSPQLCIHGNEEKAIYTRPNSEDHTMKMLAEAHSDSSLSAYPTVSTSISPRYETERVSSYWAPVFCRCSCESSYRSNSSYGDNVFEDVCPTVSEPDAIVAKAGGHLKGNPLYSSGSESSESAYHTMKRLNAPERALDLEQTSQADSFSEEEEQQSGRPRSSLAKSKTASQAQNLSGKVRTSMEDFMSIVKRQLFKTLEKLEELPIEDCDTIGSSGSGSVRGGNGSGSGHGICMVTPRKKAFVHETRQKVMSMFGSCSEDA